MTGAAVVYFRAPSNPKAAILMDPAGQTAAVEEFLRAKQWRAHSVHRDNVVGAHSMTAQLRVAATTASRLGLPIVFAYLGRIGYEEDALDILIHARVQVHFIDMPGYPPTLEALTALREIARFDQRRIAKRIKRSLADRKLLGLPVGNPGALAKSREQRRAQGLPLANIEKAVETRAKNYRIYVEQMRPIVDKAFDRHPGLSMLGFAKHLNMEGITTPRGGQWSATQAARLVHAVRMAHNTALAPKNLNPNSTPLTDPVLRAAAERGWEAGAPKPVEDEFA